MRLASGGGPDILPRCGPDCPVRTAPTQLWQLVPRRRRCRPREHRSERTPRPPAIPRARDWRTARLRRKYRPPGSSRRLPSVVVVNVTPSTELRTSKMSGPPLDGVSTVNVTWSRYFPGTASVTTPVWTVSVSVDVWVIKLATASRRPFTALASALRSPPFCSQLIKSRHSALRELRDRGR